VKTTQVAPAQRGEQAGAVPGQVFGEIGVIGADNRQFMRRAARRAAQPSGPSVAICTRSGRKAANASATPRGSPAASAPRDRMAAARPATPGFRRQPKHDRFFRILRQQQLHLITQSRAVTNQAVEGTRNAVDLGKVGFRDQADAQRLAHGVSP